MESTELLLIIERAHTCLDLSYRQIAEILGADESSLHRWRREGSLPSGGFQRLIRSLGRCLDRMETRFTDWEAARRWLNTAEGQGADTPLGRLNRGETDIVLSHLVTMDSQAQG